VRTVNGAARRAAGGCLVFGIGRPPALVPHCALGWGEMPVTTPGGIDISADSVATLLHDFDTRAATLEQLEAHNEPIDGEISEAAAPALVGLMGSMPLR
jgi:hypothetical protein